MYDLILRNGCIVDPASGRDGDVAFGGGKVAAVAARVLGGIMADGDVRAAAD